MNIAILGAGAWGTALAVSLAGRHRVVLWARDAALASAIGSGRRNARYLPEVPVPDAVTVTGEFPSAQARPTALTLAARDAGFAKRVARELHHPALRVYFSVDLAGVEISGAVKNVMAIAAGISDGLGLGLNARAALITRGLAEITRLGLALGGRTETFMGLAGAGDLILTCTGDLSRNRSVGLHLARGEPLAAILKQLGHVAEGVYSALAIEALAAEKRVDMPITRAVCAVLFRGTAPREAVQQLLARDPREEA